ncbi:N-acetylglucosamine kinase-like BadF-type ATPase [Paenibacillus castaneae]|uniref:N-acetylglucosamine kinase n=1 Tax=Paenibacillus castaneae TaxID=474957 RepID=UPI000C9B4746|nr:BadF/BadG/BcrA/BcrD ATPase family protein [Paenibacillus castaneae]NIK78293.1 N-acetylglucosamine kinase-like BadF-type ATPase [Paenibacillus castaneae]
MNYYLGVDGGGSKTYTLITDEHGNIVGKGNSGNGNHQINYEEAKGNIRESVQMALDQAGLKQSEIHYAYFGLAGADREVDYRILRPMIAQLGFPNHDINCDTAIALRAGTDQPYGVVLICGTGTNSAGVSPRKAFFQCGGFSYSFGDFGGGGDLCIEAFRSVIRAWDGREKPTLLTNLLLQDLGYESVPDMFEDFLDSHKAPPLRTVKLLFQAAAQGDEVAAAILRMQGEELGKSARAVIKRLGMEGDQFNVVLAGSVLTRGEARFIHPYIEEAVKECAPGASLVKLEVEPVIGALWLAFEAGGAKLPREVYDRLRSISDYSLV